MAKTASKKRKVVLNLEARITASFNNIIISLTNSKGEVIAWSSAEKWDLGFKKHSMRSTQLKIISAHKKQILQ